MNRQPQSERTFWSCLVTIVMFVEMNTNFVLAQRCIINPNDVFNSIIHTIIILIIICGIASVGQCHFDTGMLSGRCHSRNVPRDKPDAASISMHFNSFCRWILETEKKTKEVKVGP